MRAVLCCLLLALAACQPASPPAEPEPAGIELAWLAEQDGARIDVAPLGGTARIVSLALGWTDAQGVFHGWRAEGVAECSERAAAAAVRLLRYGEPAACLRTTQLDAWQLGHEWQLTLNYDIEPGVRLAMPRRCAKPTECPQLAD